VNGSGKSPAGAQAIGRTVTAILPAARDAPPFLEQLNAMPHGNGTKAGAGRIAVTVRPIVRAAAGTKSDKFGQLGALSPKFGKEIRKI
jgi:hypothetical protein